MREPLLLPFAGFVWGIALAGWVGFVWWELAGAGILLITLALLATQRLRPWVVGFVSLLLGVAWSQWRQPGTPPVIEYEAGEILTVAGCVVEPSRRVDGRDQFVLELAPGARARVRRYPGAGEAAPQLPYGARVEFPARLRKPRNYGNPGAFDVEAWLGKRDVFWYATLPARAEIARLPGECGSGFQAGLLRWRAGLRSRLNGLFPNQPQAAIWLAALLFGDMEDLERAWTDDFRRTGTFHALVVSGQHVAVLAGMLLLVLCWLPLPPTLAYLAAGLAAWLYALLAGATAPVLRAAGGFTLYLLARFLFRRSRPLNIVAAVGLVFLIADPAELFDASFLLTFAAVAAIGGLAVPVLDRTSQRWRKAVTHLERDARDPTLEPEVGAVRVELKLLADTLHLVMRWPRRLAYLLIAAVVRVFCFVWEMGTVTLLVQLALLLPMLAYFHRVSFTGLVANLLIAPLLSAAVPAGFLALALNSSWLGGFAFGLIEVSRQAAGVFVRWEPEWRIPAPPVWLAVVTIAAFCALGLALRARRFVRGALAAVLVTVTLCVLHPFPAQRVAGVLEVTMLDVGQSEALLVTFPDGHSMMVDAGGVIQFRNAPPPRFDVGEQVVSPYLWSRSLKTLDAAVVTHAHDDHMGGFTAVRANFQPARIYSGLWPEAPPEVRPLRRGDRLSIGGVEVTALAPAREEAAGANARNDDSLVLLLEYGRHRILLTGDIEAGVERELVALGLVPKVDVLKVAHHGSKSSSTPEFLEAAQPAIGLVSVGAGNQFRFPAAAIVDRLREHRVTLLRTDEWGAITVRSDGRYLTLDTHRWRKGRALQPVWSFEP